MRRRAMGQETEYGSMCTANGRAGNLTGIMMSFAHFVKRSDDDDRHFRTEFYENGHRVYLDVGAHMEVATAECDDPQELAHHVLAGDRNLAAAAAAFAEERRRTHLQQLGITFYKNNVCNYGGSEGEYAFGSHENYQVSGEVESHVLPLAAFLATRQLVVGAGRWRCRPGVEPVFELAQRSGFITELSSAGTVRDKPLVNLRDEAHALDTKRLHLICGDNNILPQVTALKFGFMDALLTMIEEDRFRPLRLLDPVGAVRRVSQEPGARLDVIEHFSMTALDVQRHCFDQLWQFVDGDSELSSKRAWVAVWGRHLDRLAASYDPATRTYDASVHLGELDWATKEVLVRGFMARAGTVTPAQVQRQELSLHDITSERSAHAAILRRYGQFDELAVQRARTTPPTTTRAHARGQLVADGRPDVDDWQWFRFAGQLYRLGDPLNPNLPEIVQERLSA